MDDTQHEEPERTPLDDYELEELRTAARAHEMEWGDCEDCELLMEIVPLIDEVKRLRARVAELEKERAS